MKSLSGKCDSCHSLKKMKQVQKVGTVTWDFCRCTLSYHRFLFINPISEIECGDRR